MLKYFILMGGFLFGSVSLVLAQKSKNVSVYSAEEFLEAIGSNTNIRLKAKRFLFSEIQAPPSNPNVRLEKVEDGFKIKILDVKNLKIEGEPARKPKLLTNTRYAHVLSFENCENIEITAVEAGHGPGRGYCQGGVFEFIKCNKVFTGNSLLFGSGTEGITLDQVKDAKFSRLTIRSCTYGIMTIRNSFDVSFNDCRFTDNREFDLINIYDSENIKYISCRIDFNQSGSGASYDNYAVINAPLPTGNKREVVTLENCYIEDNDCQYFCRSELATKCEDCVFNNNTFRDYASNR